MTSIAFYIQKGGTGKTSCAGNIASGLSRFGHKTALIDCDQQGNSSSWFLTSPITFELSDVLSGKADTSKAFIEIGPHLSLMPVSPLDGNLTAFSETQLIKNPKAFEFLLKDLEDLGFSFVIFDCSPSFSQLERAIIGAVDEVITPLTPEFFSMDGIEIFTVELQQIRKAQRRNIRHNKIICNLINRSFSHHLAFYENLNKLNYQIFTVPQDTHIPKAQIFHKNIYDFDPRSKAIPALDSLVKAIMEVN